MKTKQGLFLASRFVLGTSHLVFQSLADASMNAEAAVIDKVGYWDKGVQYKLSPADLKRYKVSRKHHTTSTQRKVSAKYLELSKIIEAKKKVAFKQV